MRKLNVVTFGVGVIGSLTAKFILEEKGGVMDLVGAYDIDQKKVGRDLGAVIGLGSSTGVKVSDDLRSVLTKDVDIAIHTTASYLKAAVPQIESIVARGVDVVSSCEELSYPYVVDKELTSKLDSSAKKHGVTVLGTGINPGFLMDALPIALTAPCKSIEKITVTRRMNAATRRVPFQKKVGAGLTMAEFQKAIEDGKISGHVGLEQSAWMLADAIGWKLDGVEIGEVEAVIAESPEKGYVDIPAGRVTGVKQSARGTVAGEPLIQLNFMAYVGSKEEYDQVEIEGIPPVNCRISPCIHGDHGTVAMLVNMAPKVVASQAGLRTMKDMQLPSAFL
ncbi:MAG: dihydrodipicolinate reductase [Nitrososphaerota archaeon]|nr:dihydrodipicolinate reductase [Nitrososphaerota archaeon]